ncbi:hypothetical protein DRQ50_03720 [bacterium]|nr:MAG: hypothetical protein DRQ50_03720 [bacterium]
MRCLRDAMTKTMSAIILSAVLSLVILAGCGGQGGPAPQDAPPPPPPVEKIKIDSLDELPSHSYPLTGTVSELLDDPAGMEALKTAYTADI